MSAQNPSRRLAMRWRTLKGLATLLLFVIIAALVEYAVVLFAIGLGIQDETLLQWSFIFPGTSWNVTLAVSPLLHLVPISVVLTLAASWTYLTRQVVFKPAETQKGKTGNVSRRGKEQSQKARGRIRSALSRNKGIAGSGRKTRFGRVNVRNALLVLVVFSALLLMISLLAYPRLIYRAIASAYENNPSLLSFVKGVGASVSSVGSAFSSINGALMAAAPGFRGLVLGVGALTNPLTSLDNLGRYLVVQNAAAWISALIILYYGKYGLKGFRRTRK